MKKKLTKKRIPRVGITCDFEIKVDSRGQEIGRYVLSEAYVDAVLRAGAEPLLLPHLSTHNTLSLLGFLDALVVSGGDFDIPPDLYGEEPRPKLGKVLKKRSLFELHLCRAALENDIPVLGVCGCMQLLNVALGGTLYQDVSERPGTANHVQPQKKNLPHHTITIAPQTRLFTIAAQDTWEVNSTHHQLVHKLGRGLVVSAQAPDGAVEAIELRGVHFALGVQWHPEAMASSEQDRIYQALVEATQPQKKTVLSKRKRSKT